MAKQLKWYQTLNQAPRSAKHNGQHWRASPQAYGDPTVRTDHSAGGSGQGSTVAIRAITFKDLSWHTFTIEEPKPPAIPYAGARAGEIIGHRLWWVIDGHICSLAHRRLWLPGETVHGDINKPVDMNYFLCPPIWGGTYAFLDRAQCDGEIGHMKSSIMDWSESIKKGFVVWMSQWVPLQETVTFVLGTIKMWGDVVEHERGYRAEFAKVNSIDEMFGPGDLAALRTKYGVS